jgi:hypothetical protein
MEKSYDDFDILVGDIRAYVKANQNVKIVENDDILDLAIRYQDVENDVSWKIDIKDLNEWTKTQEATERGYGDLVRRTFQTQEGKKALLDVILTGPGTKR